MKFLSAWGMPILWLAFALRVFHLDANAIWWDESLSLYRAARDLPTILANTILIQTVLTTDLQPPLYFLILHLLVPAFGASEFALRFLSVSANVATIPLLYVLGRRWFSPQVGWLAAFLGAVSPFYVWYAQEARPYTLVLFWSLLALYALVRSFSLSRFPRERVGVGAWRVTCILSAVAALYTNYYAVFLLPFHAFYSYAQTRSLKSCVLPALPALSTVLLLPIIARGAAGNVNSGPSFVPLDVILRDLVHSFSVGITLEAAYAGWIDAAMLALFLAGIIFANSTANYRRPAVATLALLLLPTLLIYLASYIRPLYQNSRYLIAWSPAWYLGIALGVAFLSRLSRYLAPVAFIAFLVGAVLSLTNLYLNPRYAKDDHRAWADSLRERAHPSDFLILDSPHTEELFNYYARGIVRYTTLPHLDAGARGAAADESAVRDALRSHPRAWFLAMHVPFDDPAARVQKLLDANGVLLDRAQFRGSSTEIALSLYAAALPTAHASDIARKTDFLFDSRLRLLGYDAPKEISAGTRGLVKLFWQLDAPAGEDYGVSLRAVDDAGARVGQWDAVPLGNAAGSSSWATGKIIVDERWLPIDAGTRSGVYRLQVQVYHSATGNGIGDAAALGQVRVP